MHRTYSMRSSRAPTASQIQSPPPPSSSTKSGRFFGKANIGTSCNQSFARSPFPRLFSNLAGCGSSARQHPRKSHATTKFGAARRDRASSRKQIAIRDDEFVSLSMLTWTLRNRPHLPPQVGRRFRPRPREEAFTARWRRT
jgi:hypothetical protein